jgi:IS5 family transposase
MEQVVPWAKLQSLIEPYYPKAGNGRRPVGLERMLRIYFLQQWFNLSDPGVEEALYDSVVMRSFAGIDLGREPVPDETTVCKFRHLLEEHRLGGEMLETVNRHLEDKGIRITRGTIVDATIIAAPSSTKNREQKRDPEMHQTKKGNQWYFGVFRDEGPCGSGQQAQADPHSGGDCGQHRRWHGVAGAVAWRGDAGVGRSGVSGAEAGDT